MVLATRAARGQRSRRAGPEVEPHTRAFRWRNIFSTNVQGKKVITFRYTLIHHSYHTLYLKICQDKLQEGNRRERI